MYEPTIVITHDAPRVEFIGPLHFVIEVHKSTFLYGEKGTVLSFPGWYVSDYAADELARRWQTTAGAVRSNGSSWHIEDGVARLTLFEP